MKYNARMSLAAFVLAVSFCSYLSISVGPAASENRVIPEYYVPRSLETCIEKVELREARLAARRMNFLDKIEALYDFSDGWRKGAVVVGSDYVDFRSFLIVTFNACNVHSLERTGADSIVHEMKHSTRVLKSSPFVAPAILRSGYPNGSSLFFHLLGKPLVGDCLLSLDFPTSEAALEGDRKIALVWQKYRLPIADLMYLDKRVFVLFSRDCIRKPSLYAALQLVAYREFPSTGIGVSHPHMTPAAGEYLTLRSPGAKEGPYIVRMPKN